MRHSIYKLVFVLPFFWPISAVGSDLEHYQQKIRSAGDDMLENLEISYVYGGNKIGDVKTCDDCNRCLESKRPAPKLRVKECPSCGSCSVDCSHFTQLVFARAGLDFPYITSLQMRDLSAEALEKNYRLRPVGTTIGHIIAGDMLVYRGHVVIVETVHDRDSADIIHATGGKDIREPGQGIQRERFARMSSFRGELLRVIRHVKLDQLFIAQAGLASPGARTQRPFKMRPVEKRQVN